MSKPICYVMVGLPAMGKSTLVSGMYKDAQTFIYSTDNYIEKHMLDEGYSTYDEAFEHMIDEATREMNVELSKMIEWKNDIIWDQTNLGVGKRRKIINRMKQAGYQLRCECIVPPEEGHLDDLKVWKTRLESRPGKTIPADIISKMYSGYVIPTIEEGFDMITFYNMHGALLGIDIGDTISN